MLPETRVEREQEPRELVRLPLCDVVEACAWATPFPIGTRASCRLRYAASGGGFAPEAREYTVVHGDRRELREASGARRRAARTAVAAYNPDVDRDLITRAFHFAAKAHEGQLRRSGQEFIHHPLGVARILAELQLDDETIAAALLHDVVEDTETELDDIRAEFGDEVARLVDGVTKLTRISSRRASRPRPRTTAR